MLTVKLLQIQEPTTYTDHLTRPFLKEVEAVTPKELDLHLVLDNYATHKTPAVKAWLLKHHRVVLHFTPTSASWLNLVERWFAELTRRKLQRSAHRSVIELERDIIAWTKAWNDNPRPFVWTKTADQILEISPATANELTPHDTRRSCSSTGSENRGGRLWVLTRTSSSNREIELYSVVPCLRGLDSGNGHQLAEVRPAQGTPAGEQVADAFLPAP